MYVEDKSPVLSKRRNLEPKVEQGDFCWTIRETGWTGTTKDLADEIAKAIADHYDQYNANLSTGRLADLNVSSVSAARRSECSTKGRHADDETPSFRSSICLGPS
jgi:hypothetical protein